MSPKQWLLITAIVVLNIIVFATLLGKDSSSALTPPTPTWTPPPTFTPIPIATATAILMPTLSAPPTPTPLPTPIVHVVEEGETLDSIAEQYDVSAFILRMVNRIAQTDEVSVGQLLLVPAIEE
jgi:hypothetical protein